MPTERAAIGKHTTENAEAYQYHLMGRRHFLRLGWRNHLSCPTPLLEGDRDRSRLRQRTDREGWRLVSTYTDRAISGANHLRPGYQKLIEDARNGQFDVVVSEALDRLSRDQEHVAGLFKQLQFSQVRIVTVAEGEISELHVGLKGTMNALFLKDLAIKIHRGMEGRVVHGHSAGGKPYGYDVVRAFDSAGQPIRGQRTINQAEATIIRRIYREFAEGRSPRAIARGLNAEGLTGPGGRAWRAGTIAGHSRRRNGILRNDIYKGLLVWNRQKFIKDPQTGKRVTRLNPESEWVVHELPELKIVDLDLWNAVNQRLRVIEQSPAAQKIRASRFWERRRPQHLLTGLIRCGNCGGSYTAVGAAYLACAAARNQGSCTNRRGIRRNALELFILETLKHHLMHPDLVKEFIAAFTAEVNRERQTQETGLHQRRRELVDVTRRLNGLIEAIADGLRSPGLQQKLEELENRKERLETDLSGVPAPKPRLHPNLAELYRRRVSELEIALHDPSSREEALQLLRGLIQYVEIRPGRKAYQVEFVGDIAQMIMTAHPELKLRVGRDESSVKVVAEERYPLYRIRRPWLSSPKDKHS